MSYILQTFGNYILPTGYPVTDVGTGPSQIQILELPGGGMFDTQGAYQSPRAAFDIVYRCRLIATTEAALDTAYTALRALRGTRERLYRRHPNGDIEWVYARLEIVNAQRDVGNKLYFDVELIFRVLSAVWNGSRHDAGWDFDSGEYFDTGLFFDSADFSFTLNTSPKTVTVTNGGNATVDDVKITVTAGSAAITNLVIEKVVGATTYGHLVYAGTIAAGKSLVIDCGARKVENDGADAYDLFSFGASHISDGWIRLSSGDNSIKVTITGGSTDSSIIFEFWDGWE